MAARSAIELANITNQVCIDVSFALHKLPSALARLDCRQRPGYDKTVTLAAADLQQGSRPQMLSAVKSAGPDSVALAVWCTAVLQQTKHYLL